jgi:hypothetical protein
VSLLAPASLALLLALAGSLAGPRLFGAREGRAYRLALALAAGAVLGHLLLNLWSALGVPWTRASVLAPLAAVAVAGAAVAWGGRRRPPDVGRSHPGWGDALAALALLAFGGAAYRLWIVTPDFIYHWGIKGHRYYLARGIDYDFLTRSWNWIIHPDYPNLVPELYAATALVLGRFSEEAMMVWSAIWFAALVAAARETVARGGLDSRLQQAAVAAVALAAAQAGIGYLMAGGADWLLAFALLAALPPLLDPGARHADLQVGALAAFAAAAKVEGVVLGGLLVLVHGVTRWRTVGRPRPAALAALALPGLLVVGPWLWTVLRLALVGKYNVGPLDSDRLGVVAASLWAAMNDRAWHGLSWTLLLLPWLLRNRRTRPAAVIVALQIGFYLYTYFTARVDVALLIATSWPRLLLHVIPSVLVLAALAWGGNDPVETARVPEPAV